MEQKSDAKVITGFAQHLESGVVQEPSKTIPGVSGSLLNG